MALFDCAINEKYCSVDGGGAFALFFPPHPWGFDSSRIPNPREFAFRGKKKCQCSGGQPVGKGGWAQVELINTLISNFRQEHPTTVST